MDCFSFFPLGFFRYRENKHFRPSRTNSCKTIFQSFRHSKSRKKIRVYLMAGRIFASSAPGYLREPGMFIYYYTATVLDGKTFLGLIPFLCPFSYPPVALFLFQQLTYSNADRGVGSGIQTPLFSAGVEIPSDA